MDQLQFRKTIYGWILESIISKQEKYKQQEYGKSVY